MAQSLTTPISELIRTKNSDGDEPKRKTREEYKQAKELEEARKLGTVPAAVDEEGKDINPHIPQYISQAPWYIGTTHATLKHQRMRPEDQKQYSKLTEWYKRGVDTTSVATKFRKGACENCGALTHKRKDCLERPRKTLARYTGAAIAPDEHSQPTLSLDFDGKRDRWNGYDPTEYNQVVEEHRKVEEAKRQLKANKLKAGSSTAEEEEHDGGGGSDSEDDDKYAEGVDMPGTKVDSKQRITVRNLRIREDTAKYLRNLALDSAYYDPKTRSMRENPYEGKGNQDVDYQGENFVRFSGDTSKVARTQLFAWDAQKSGVDVHVISDPTRLELLQRQYEQNRDKLEGTAKGSLLERYGGQEHLQTLPRQLLLAQSEDYVEYSRQGKVLRGAENEVVRSQYEEDVYVNNHSSVWGSFWRDGVWGYKCCHGSVKNSYCTGEAGREAAASDPVLALTSSSSSMPPPTAKVAAAADGVSEDDEKTQLQDRQRLATMLERDARQAKKRERKRKKAEKKQKKKQKRKRKDLSSSDSGSEESEDEEEARKRKVAQAMVAQMAQEASAARLLKMDERKRPYNSMVDISEPTPEEMEAWRMRQTRQDDPMANFTTDC